MRANVAFSYFPSSFHIAYHSAFSSNIIMKTNVSDLGCYLPGRTFSIISPSVGAECSCLVSLRAKNHIRRTQLRRMYKGVEDTCVS